MADDDCDNVLDQPHYNSLLCLLHLSADTTDKIIKQRVINQKQIPKGKYRNQLSLASNASSVSGIASDQIECYVRAVLHSCFVSSPSVQVLFVMNCLSGTQCAFLDKFLFAQY